MSNPNFPEANSSEEHDQSIVVSSSSSTEGEQWMTLIAHAWKNPELLKKLRQNPTAEIERLKNLPDGDPDYVGDISDLGTADSAYYFPLPEVPSGHENDSVDALKQFLRDNPDLFGIMRWCAIE